MSVKKIWKLLSSGEFEKTYKNLIKVVRGPEDLVLLNYTDACQTAGAWDEITTICRGLMLRPSTKEVVARPLPKFFNHNERHVTIPDEPFVATEKVDGSLGIFYRTSNGPALSTRGSFDSPEAKAGTAMLRRLRDVHEIFDSFTPLFEIVRKDAGSSLVRYDRDDLRLLAIVDRFSGEEADTKELDHWRLKLGCGAPKRYPFASFEAMVEQSKTLPLNFEGYVARFDSGLRVKVKSPAYTAALRDAVGVTPGKVLSSLQDGTYDAWYETVPEELHPYAEAYAEKYRQREIELRLEAESHFARAPRDGVRSDFARWVQSSVPQALRGTMFHLLEGRAINWFDKLEP